MTHLTCPKCQSNDHMTGYGLAAGPMGTYVFCNSCDELIDFSPDQDGMDDDQIARSNLRLDMHMRAIWGEKYDPETHRLKAEAYNQPPPKVTQSDHTVVHLTPKISCDCKGGDGGEAPDCTYPDCQTFGKTS